jgi:hypothetical protein
MEIDGRNGLYDQHCDCGVATFYMVGMESLFQTFVRVLFVRRCTLELQPKRSLEIPMVTPGPVRTLNSVYFQCGVKN